MVEFPNLDTLKQHYVQHRDSHPAALKIIMPSRKTEFLYQVSFSLSMSADIVNVDLAFLHQGNSTYVIIVQEMERTLTSAKLDAKSIFVMGHSKKELETLLNGFIEALNYASLPLLQEPLTVRGRHVLTPQKIFEYCLDSNPEVGMWRTIQAVDYVSSAGPFLCPIYTQMDDGGK